MALDQVRTGEKEVTTLIEQVKVAYRYLLVMGAGAVMLMLSTMVPVLSTTADFSIYNTSWNGCSGIGKDAYDNGSLLPTIDLAGSTEETVMHRSFSGMRKELDPGSSTIVIIGPRTDFTSEEGRFAHDFLAFGGLILIADDFGTGNSLLGLLNTTTRISSSLMLDLSFMKKGEFSVATDIAEHRITRGVENLLMNHPAAVQPSKGSFGMVNSSGSSWLDSDGDGRQGAYEPRGPFNVLTEERYGEGRLIVLSEPSLLINQMRGKMDNDRLVRNLLGYISENRTTLLIDESHRDLTDPVRVMNDLIGVTGGPTKIGILVLLMVGFIFIQTPYPKAILNGLRTGIDRLLAEAEPVGPSANEIMENVMKEHPDWNRAMLERIISDLRD